MCAGPMINQDSLRTETMLLPLAPQPDKAAYQLALQPPSTASPSQATSSSDSKVRACHMEPRCFGSLGMWRNRSEEKPPVLID